MERLMSRHTPGPWRFRVVDSGDPAGIAIYSVKGESVATIKSARSGGVIDPHKEANARLIAAAPEMLAMLKRVYVWGHIIPFGGEMQALIAKAEPPL